MSTNFYVRSVFSNPIYVIFIIIIVTIYFYYLIFIINLLLHHIFTIYQLFFLIDITLNLLNFCYYTIYHHYSFLYVTSQSHFIAPCYTFTTPIELLPLHNPFKKKKNLKYETQNEFRIYPPKQKVFLARLNKINKTHK